MLPWPCFGVEAAITEAVIYAAIKADMITPIAPVPEVSLASPTPVTGSPEVANPRRDDPGSGNPIVLLIIVVVSPVAGSPDVAITRTNGLLVHGKRWRSNTDPKTEGPLSGGDGREHEQKDH